MEELLKRLEELKPEPRAYHSPDEYEGALDMWLNVMEVVREHIS